MSIIEQWNQEEMEHREMQRATFPMSGNRVRRGPRDRKRDYVKSPNRAYMTSKLMSTTFKYKNTTVATILKYMLLNNERATNVSQILRFALEGMESMILNSEPSCEISSEHEATQFLNSNGIFTNSSKANQKRIVNNLTLESVFDRPIGVRSYQAQSINESRVPQEEINQAMKELSKIEGPQVYFDESTVSNMNKAKISIDVDKSNETGIPDGWPKPSELKSNISAPKQFRLLNKDGTTKWISSNNRHREQVMIVCMECSKPSSVLLNFELISEQIHVIANCCPTHEPEITDHRIVTPKEMQEGINILEERDGEYSNSEMKRILQQMRENNQQVGAAERKG